MEQVFIGRSALVLGGTGGLGLATAKALAASGASLVIHGGSSRDRLDRALAAFEASGSAARGFLQPVEGPEAVYPIGEELRQCDILVVALGPFLRKSLSDMEPADWARIALLDFAFPGACISVALPGMLSRGWGRILLFGGSCTDTIRGFSTTAGYSAAKTGLASLAKSVARAGSGKGVTCNLICPGFVETEYLGSVERERQSRLAPGGRLLSPSEIAGTALSLLSNPVLSGAVVTLDGGLAL